MRGIAGVLNLTSSCSQVEQNEIAMAGSIAYRGADDVDIWSDLESFITLTHRRLTVADLSLAGHQPMASDVGRSVNFLDGIDWITVKEVISATALLAASGLMGALPAGATLVAVDLSGTMVGFAPFNKPVAQIFYRGALGNGLTVNKIVSRIFVVNIALTASATLFKNASLTQLTMLTASRSIAAILLWTFSRTRVTR